MLLAGQDGNYSAPPVSKSMLGILRGVGGRFPASRIHEDIGAPRSLNALYLYSQDSSPKPVPRTLNLQLETDWPVCFQLRFKFTGEGFGTNTPPNTGNSFTRQAPAAQTRVRKHRFV